MDETCTDDTRHKPDNNRKLEFNKNNINLNKFIWAFYQISYILEDYSVEKHAI